MKPQRQIVPANNMIERSKVYILKNNYDYNCATRPSKPKRKDLIIKYLSKLLFGFLGVLFLATLIVPSILIYELTPKNSTDSSKNSDLSTYTNYCNGLSPKSTWEINTTYVMTMNINTTQCNFPSTPLYFVSINGDSSLNCLLGVNAIYFPTKQSFQIYATSRCSWNATVLISLAISYGWDVNWVGFYR